MYISHKSNISEDILLQLRCFVVVTVSLNDIMMILIIMIITLMIYCDMKFLILLIPVVYTEFLESSPV